ncbi:MAG: hypothetical protein RMK29_14725 [Myxococcales bacterium]|nr:hypothetical protein [Myxococcota bacterium]MDW8282967.1 hypothetical protein [Myxococcales bacterium]
MLRWTIAPQTRADVDSILSEFASLHAKFGPVIGIGVVPPELPVPEGDVRRYINEKMPELLSHAETLHYVIEGQGFKNSILRSVVVSLLLLTGKRGQIYVHKSFEEAVEALTPRLAELKILPARLHLAAFNAMIHRPGRTAVGAASEPPP